MKDTIPNQANSASLKTAQESGRDSAFSCSSGDSFACVGVGLKNGQVVVKSAKMPPDVALLLASQIITVARDAILQTECERLAGHQKA